MPDPAIATAADYADALFTSRRAKNVLVLILLLLLITQLGIFFAVRFEAINISSATTRPASPHTIDLLQYLIGAIDFVGVTLSIVLCIVLLLIVTIMLVGRLIGVARLTSAFVWSLILIVLLFPWQAFLSNATFSDTSFKIPGVLYTWDELRANGKFPNSPPDSILKWARFVVFPFVGVIVCLIIQAKSNRGIRQAFGETDDIEPAAGAATRA
jgi:hypothetical protein